jgi:hypothetical protein
VPWQNGHTALELAMRFDEADSDGTMAQLIKYLQAWTATGEAPSTS